MEKSEPYKYADPVTFSWVVGRFEGKPANRILDLGYAGAGYYILESGRLGRDHWCLAAFAKPDTGSLPDHLTKVTDPILINKLNKWRSGK